MPKAIMPKGQKADKGLRQGKVNKVSGGEDSPIGTPVDSEREFNFDTELVKIQVGLQNKDEPSLETVSQAISTILSTLQEVVTALKSQATSYSELLNESKQQTKTIEKLVLELGEVKNENKELKSVNEVLSSKVNDLEQYSKNYNLEVQGIPEQDNENTYTIVTAVANKLGSNITEDDIEFCHRLRKSVRNPARPASIIVKFYSRQIKEIVLSGKKRYKELRASDLDLDSHNNNKVYINEHLTAVNKNLFYLARNAKQSLGFKYAWTKNGNVFLRKDEVSPVIRVNKPADVPLSAAEAE
jgi:Baculovirus FP protein